jgi:hypothetical protein
MPALNIDFQSGFKNDTVVILVNNNEVFRKDNVQTLLLTDHAESVSLDIEKGSVCIDIIIDTKNLRKAINADIMATTYLGISIVMGAIEHMVSGEPFGYA